MFKVREVARESIQQQAKVLMHKSCCLLEQSLPPIRVCRMSAATGSLGRQTAIGRVSRRRERVTSIYLIPEYKLELGFNMQTMRTLIGHDARPAFWEISNAYRNIYTLAAMQCAI